MRFFGLVSMFHLVGGFHHTYMYSLDLQLETMIFVMFQFWVKNNSRKIQNGVQATKILHNFKKFNKKNLRNILEHDEPK